MDALGLWELLTRFNFAVKPKGTVFPYFCTAIKGERNPIKVRLLMLEGWQTLHDFVRLRVDASFGFYTSPMEMPHLELVVLENGEPKLFRHDPGYMPMEATGVYRAMAEKILWEIFGFMLRLEGDNALPMKFAGEQAVFSRVETEDGTWIDQPLVIPDPPPHTEKVVLPSADVKAAKDLPFEKDVALDVDFRMLPGIMTREKRPRCVYGLIARDSKTHEKVMDFRVSAHPDIGLKGLWETMPVQVLKTIVSRGRIPGEIRVCSGRVFRLLRPLCLELPFKLSLHDDLVVSEK